MAMAAEPMLASSLWSPEAAAPAKQRLQTHSKAIDTALNGGLDYGNITCISADADAGARDITQALLVSHLLGSKEASATVIDTGQAVDVRRLYQTVLAPSPEHDQTAAEATAKAALDRVKLMKSFDFEGLTEALSELRDALEGRVPQEKPPRGTVADSQADEDEMLDSPTPPAPKPVNMTTSTARAETEIQKGVLIIDNITQLAAPLLKTNHASGQALITSFMRSLGHLTKTHNLCTVIMNSTMSTRGQNFKEESPSAFASSIARPALGRTWTYLVDAHLLVHRMPKSGKGARVVHGGQMAEGKGETEMVSVVEVVQDRYDGRVGKWAAFGVGEGGELREVV